MSLIFGNVGVCVEGYTKESLYELLEEHGLESLIDIDHLSNSTPYADNMYLQSQYARSYREVTTISVYKGFIHFVTDMENYLHILRVGILDPDAANSLIGELYIQGLIKPRNESWDVLTLVM